MIILGVSSVQQNCFEFVLVFLIARNDYVECLKFFSKMVLKCSLFYLIPRNDYVGCLKFCIIRCSLIFKLTKLPKLRLFINMLIITQLVVRLSSLQPQISTKTSEPLISARFALFSTIVVKIQEWSLGFIFIWQSVGSWSILNIHVCAMHQRRR